MRHTYLRFCCLLTGLSMLLCFIGPTSVRAEDDNEYVPNQVLVKLAPTANVLTIAAAYGLSTVLGSIDQLASHPIYRLRIVDGTPPPEKAAALASNPLVIYAEPNYLGDEPEGYQQSSWSKGDDVGSYTAQWAPRVMRLPEAHSITNGAKIIVAVLDTGVDRTHPALAGRLVAGFDFVDGDLDPSEEGVYGQDMAYGHGTHVSGLVALAAPDAKIMPLRILKPDGTGDSWLLAQAVRYAFSNRASVINLSYGVTHRSMLIDDILTEVTTARPGVVVAAAAGNSGTTTPEYPAAEDVPGLLAVAASTKADKLADWSTRGAWVQVAAPGDRILSTVPLDSGSAYGTWSGTSMATPLTAGTAALVRAAYPNLTPAEVATRIISTAATITGPVPRRVDAAAALGLPATVP